MATSNNPKNENSALFKRLTRLFSGPIVNYRSQNTRQLRRRRLDKYARTFNDVSGQKFERMGFNPLENLSSYNMSTQSRVTRYADFDQMEYTPELASALDIFADEITTFNSYNKMLRVRCSDEEIKQILNTLYYKVLNLEFNAFGWSRTMCKYGDFYLYLDIDEQLGVKNVIGLPSREVERLEGLDKNNPNYVQFQWNSAGVTFENFQIAHFRILGNDKFAPYGTSVLDPARRIWRQLTLLEDSMMAYRIVRSAERRVFYVDVGNINPQEVEQHMQRFISAMKRNQIVDPDTGKVDLRYNPLSVEEDYFIPVRAGINTRIENLPGGQYVGQIDDVKYLQDKMFSAIKVPMSYLIRGDGAEEDKQSLATKDIRFSKTIQRLQLSLISELEKIGKIHLYILGYRGDDLNSFELKLNNPSKIAELQELETWRTKFDVGGAATEGFFSKRWIADNIFDVSEEEFLRNQRELFFDRKLATQLDKVAEEELEAAAGGGFGGLEGDLDGEGPSDLEGLGGEEELGDAPEGGDEEDILLAKPDGPDLSEPAGKRDDKPKVFIDKDGNTTTKRSKGKKYKPVKDDKRRHMGPRHRQTSAQASDELAKLPSRQIRMNLGADELIRLGRGIFEEKQTNYDVEEEKLILETKQEIKDLFKEMEI